MLGIKNYKSSNILNIFYNNFKIKYRENYNFFIIKNKKNISKIKKIKNKSSFFFCIIKKKKIKLIDLFNIFYQFQICNIKLQKNPIIVYKFQKEMIANNFIPDWPGEYRNELIINNLTKWFEIFLRILYHFNKIELILIRIK